MSAVLPMTIRTRRLGSLAMLAMLTGCQAIPPAAPPAAAPPPPPPQALPPAPVPTSTQDWDVAPVVPGDWRIVPGNGGTVAQFGPAGSAPLVVLRCVTASRQISLERVGATGTTLTIRTSTGPLTWQATPATTGVQVTRPAGDVGFDWIAYSRGRISIESAGSPRLIVPVWSEISRVVEDCRN